MEAQKTKSLRNIEEKMEGLDTNSLRYHILQSAKNFKTSWIELGRALYSVWKDKLYKEWGYQKFEAYTAKEIGIRKQTAMKLLKSYYFLEKEEPAYLKEGYASASEPARLPNYEAVNILRLAKDRRALDNQDYAHLKRQVFQEGKDPSTLRKDLTTLIRQREELEPAEALEKRKTATLKRLLSTLKSLKKEIEIGKLLPASIIKEAAALISKLEEQLP